MAYADVATLKQYLGNTTNSDDALLAALLARAQKAIDTYTRRTFEASADSTKYLDCAPPYVHGRYLHVSEVGDLCAITTITNGDSTTISASVYVLEPRNGTPYRAIKLKDNSTVSWTYSGTPENAISIAGRWAYATSAPEDIVHACIRLAGFYYKQKDAGTFDTVAVPEAGIITVPQGMPRDVQIILNPYRRML